MPDTKLTARIPTPLRERIDGFIARLLEGGERRRYSLNDFLLDASEEKLRREEQK